MVGCHRPPIKSLIPYLTCERHPSDFIVSGCLTLQRFKDNLPGYEAILSQEATRDYFRVFAVHINKCVQLLLGVVIQ